MPRRYKSVEKCRDEITDYINKLEAATDNRDPELRDEESTNRYKQDLRWYDHWLDKEEIDSVLDVTSQDSHKMGRELSKEFNGTTPLYRWDRIHTFHEWLTRMEYTESNPYNKWHDDKDEEFGLTKSTEQSRQLEEDEDYAVSQKEVRSMEKAVNTHRIRDQLIIRMLWQTGIRRKEASGIRIKDVDRNEREITIRAKFAKNNKKRVVAYQASLDGLLTEWLDHGRRDEMSAGRDHDRMFVGERGAPLSDDRINDIVVEAADQAGINRKLYADANAGVDEDGEPIPNRWLITAHNIRHGFGTYMVDETNAGLWEVSKQMGHKSVDITEDLYIEPDKRSGIDHVHEYGPE